jgi:hypothetical protein
MAIVTRYFSTAAAGAGDGTTWADRAALFSSGNWSSVITGFDFSGSDSLRCLIGPGTYTCSQALAAGLFTNAPTVANHLFLEGYDGSNRIVPADGGWVSAQPAWDDSGLPVIATSTSIVTINLPQCLARFLKFTASGRNGDVLNNLRLDWCVAVNSTNNAGASVLGNSLSRADNTVIACTGDAYARLGNPGPVRWTNMRMEGNASASSGNRDGIENLSNATRTLIMLTVINNPGRGVADTATAVGATMELSRCVIANNGGTGVQLNATASQTGQAAVRNCMVTGNGGYGIDAQNAARVIAALNRLRNNTSGNFNGFGNYPTDLDNETGTGSDSDEFVDAAGGDFRIKNTSSLWGKGYGVSDEPAPGGGSVSQPNMRGGFQ